jgi:hypothetical protein
MRRTQLYLEDDVWNTLRVRSRQSGLTVSELVRRAVREHYLAPQAQRQQAMQALVGLRKGRPDIGDTDFYIRELRRGRRLKTLAGS